MTQSTMMKTPKNNLTAELRLLSILLIHNLPNPDCSVLPVQTVFDRLLRDTFMFARRFDKFSDHQARLVCEEPLGLETEGKGTVATLLSFSRETYNPSFRCTLERSMLHPKSSRQLP